MAGGPYPLKEVWAAKHEHHVVSKPFLKKTKRCGHGMGVLPLCLRFWKHFTGTQKLKAYLRSDLGALNSKARLRSQGIVLDRTNKQNERFRRDVRSSPHIRLRFPVHLSVEQHLESPYQINDI